MATKTSSCPTAEYSSDEARARRQRLAKSFTRAAQTADEAGASARAMVAAMGAKLLKVPGR